MGIAKRREREKEQRRNMILDAAEKLFFTRGIHHTTMDDVAEAAELSKGTLYLYFRNKDDIYHGIHLRGMTILREMFEEAVRSKQTGLEKVRAIGEAYYRYSQEYSRYFNAMLYYVSSDVDYEDPTSFGYQCYRCGEEVMKIVAGAIQTGIADGSIRANLDPLKTAYLLRGQTTGVIQIIMSEGEHLENHLHMDAEELIPELFEMIAAALRPNNTPSH